MNIVSSCTFAFTVFVMLYFFIGYGKKHSSQREPLVEEDPKNEGLDQITNDLLASVVTEEGDDKSFDSFCTDEEEQQNAPGLFDPRINAEKLMERAEIFSNFLRRDSIGELFDRQLTRRQLTKQKTLTISTDL